jgi:lipid A ethanolaminephosphotransferase
MKKSRLVRWLSGTWWEREFDLVNFILSCSLANTVLFQWPLYSLAISSRSAFDWDAGLALATLFVLQLAISITVLGLAALVSVRLLKLLCILLTFGNAVALYFIVQYKVMMDVTMIGNIVNTNFSEASELAHPKLLLYVAFFGVLPALLILRIRIAESTRLRRGGFVLLSMVLASAWLYANAQSWLWIDKNAKQFGGLILPWSYVANTVRHYKHEADRNRKPELLPAITSKDPRGIIFVLVIGESARAQNFSLFGYPRETNELLKQSGVVPYAGAHSCTTYTIASLRCMLSYKGSDGINGNDEPLPGYLYRHGIEVIWRTNNFGEPPMKLGSFETADQIRKKCTTDCQRLNYDEVLLQGLSERLRNAAHGTKTLVVLHQAGSHGPQYSKKYPPEFEKFKPACKSVELQKCSAEELINAYDNTIVYTDYFLSRVIGLLKTVKDRPSVMLYMSDHGESLGEGGLYLHGIPMAIAPDVQTAVPLLVWTSDDFVRAGKSMKTATTLNKNLSHDVVFHSVMGAMGLSSDVYIPAHDLFSPLPTTVSSGK